MKKSARSDKDLRIKLLCFVVALLTSLNAEWLTIHNDFNQYDMDGNAIKTRSGCLSKFGETYYWYGCDGAMTNQTCYSSTDLLHWKNHGNMLTATRGTNRMDVLYNDFTKKYVMVLKWETPGTEWCTRGIATSDSPTGPFTKLFDSLVYGVNTGDMSVFKDDDGKAYYLYELWNNGRTSLGFSLMTPDYIGLEKKMQQWTNTDREASMMMKNHGMYYYMTSLMMGIDPTETQYFTAPKLEGPWTTRLVPIIAPGDMDKKSWDTQCDFVVVA
jgi:beta-xylosidase